MSNNCGSSSLRGVSRNVFSEFSCFSQETEDGRADKQVRRRWRDAVTQVTIRWSVAPVWEFPSIGQSALLLLARDRSVGSTVCYTAWIPLRAKLDARIPSDPSDVPGRVL